MDQQRRPEDGALLVLEGVEQLAKEHAIIKTVTSTVVVSDATGEEIKSGGWELRGLQAGETYHFKKLSELTAALLDNPRIFGLSPAIFAELVEEARGGR